VASNPNGKAKNPLLKSTASDPFFNSNLLEKATVNRSENLYFAARAKLKLLSTFALALRSLLNLCCPTTPNL